MRTSLLFVLTALVFCLPGPRAQGRESPTTIILIRHAEKDTMKTDPPLTLRGGERAQLLARMLKTSGVRSTHTTQYRRTQATMAPTDSLLGITNEIFEANPESLEAHAVALVRHLLASHRGETTAVSSHSNVLPLILRALGIDAPITIGDRDYDNLFVVTFSGTSPPAFVRLQMGME